MLEEKKIKRPKAIPHFGSCDPQGAMLGSIIKERHLAGREMVDSFMTKEVIVESLAYLIQVFHRNKDILNFGKQPWLNS